MPELPETNLDTVNASLPPLFLGRKLFNLCRSLVFLPRDDEGDHSPTDEGLFEHANFLLFLYSDDDGVGHNGKFHCAADEHIVVNPVPIDGGPVEYFQIGVRGTDAFIEIYEDGTLFVPDDAAHRETEGLPLHEFDTDFHVQLVTRACNLVQQLLNHQESLLTKTQQDVRDHLAPFLKVK